MLFSTPAFLVFFLIYLCLHAGVPRSYRLYLIIAGSTVFYAWWRLEYAWLPYALTGMAYGGTRWMERAATQPERRRRATVAIVALFVPLLVVKYTDFVYRDVLGPLAGWQGDLLHLPLPLGISFVTFTLTAYLVDIYKGKFTSPGSVSTVLAYVLFFPHLIAGPILRPGELIPQLEQPRGRRGRLVVPVAIFTLGLVKKLVLADQLAVVVDGIYQQAAPLDAPTALLAMYAFAVQIYCDFSGYTDMAIGLALMLGVRLPTNFRRPYAARTIIDFWRRWHITLSFWLRDYLYFPLGGNRQGRVREFLNIVITMAVGGLWHGANWTFVVWGLFHGLGVAAHHAIRRLLPPGVVTPAWLGVIATFHFVAIGWVFFRAPTMARAAAVLAAAAGGGGWSGLSALVAANGFAVAVIAAFFLTHRFDDHRRVRAATRYVPGEILWPVIVVLWIIAIAISQGSSAKFIYFDF